ncbi:B-cell antigen receptor complex-associated protein alpha chain [Anoplopoma fimbria]|uniref:B-cell antigen receptor complex-associated protein alpha chain n=1 Tax=Anoplopoma fimbria TaxID=229290 RepID=UPI0023EA8144|nr:B-cell antigen receptor complex-associated protein alpha chain [Anoplopoma fimbria]
MGTITNVLLCIFVVGFAQTEVILEPDRPFLRVQVYNTAELECCWTAKSSGKFKWIKHLANKTIHVLEHSPQGKVKYYGQSCGNLTLDPVQLNDTGFYQCQLIVDDIYLISHGTYLQVYKPMEKTINLSEKTKNRILTAQGILLLLCVLVPSLIILFKSKRLYVLEKKKSVKEEENIYQGLNLDECWSTYDQIERSQAHGPYQDVGNIKEEEEQIQLEKP